MATVTPVKLAAGKNTVSPTTLGASNTMTYEPGKRQTLIVQNPTGGGIACVIDGSGGSSVKVPGVPGGVDVSGGYALSTIQAGGMVVTQLDSISEYLKGTISITGNGLTAAIVE